MSIVEDQSGQKQPRKGIGRRMVIPLALVSAIGVGFASGKLGGPLLFTPKAAASDSAPVDVDAGTFPIIISGTKPQMVGASVSIRLGAPDGANQLHDAVLALLTEASALPLVLDRRTSLPDLEKVVMSMAQISAPWLVSLDLEPAIDPEPADDPKPAKSGH